MRSALIVAAACALASGIAACGGSGTSGSAGSGAQGKTIPTAMTSTTGQDRTVTTVTGAPRVRQFTVPPRFWCLKARPRQAQVTVGWNVPSAAHVSVLLDGRPVHPGIRTKMPFSVQAGDASGIGTTVVFPCRPGRTHLLTVRWRAGGSPWTERHAKIRRVGS